MPKEPKAQERRTVSMRRPVYDAMSKLAEARGLSLASEVDRLLVRELEAAGVEIPPLILRQYRPKPVVLDPLIEFALAEFNRGRSAMPLPKVSMPEPPREQITLPRPQVYVREPAYDPPPIVLCGKVQSQHIEF
jgi:hypothetical protein